MMRNVRTSMVLWMVLGAGLAHAKGAWVSADRLSDKDRGTLLALIAEAKVQHPEAFAQVAALREQMPALDSGRRGRMVPVSPMLKRLGPNGLWPMLEALAFESSPRGSLSDSAWFAWRLGLAEAVGMLRDVRALPVLVAALDAPDIEPRLVRSAAEAVARLGSDAAVAVLLDRAQKFPGERRKMLLSGMGDCRRLRTAQYLAGMLDSTQQDAPLAKLLVEALASSGNAWAWSAGGGTAPSEEGAVREVAARALMQAFVRFDGEVRQAASNGLMVVDAPQTLSLLREARKDAPGLSAELDTLEARFARNPTRVRR